MVLGKNIAHDMKSGAEGAHFFGALLLTFSFDKHRIYESNVIETTTYSIQEAVFAVKEKISSGAALLS